MPVPHDLIDSPGTILLDGAMGTELHRRGVDTALPLWSAGALESAPDMVRTIHQNYVMAGSRIITANTFRTTTFTYLRAGYEIDDARATAHHKAQLAVSLARDAAGNQALVAGSMAPVADCYSPHDYPGISIAKDTYRELAHWLKEAGTDLLLLETHITLEETQVALQSAMATGLPVLVSFLINEDLNLWGGKSLHEAIKTAVGEGAAGILINCVTLPLARMGVDALAAQTDGLFGVYANAGRSHPSMDGAIAEKVPDEEYVAAALQWKAAGARMIGGCCGTTPSTIELMNKELSRLA
ncbi:MAG: homocysteine S-methyltransferase family protein [Fidelibacterota bacterium]|nr:MAG: homocysteine S-methyltransferase family protein [Candidatus Neomarinimicrobiota bacterium]